MDAHSCLLLDEDGHPSAHVCKTFCCLLQRGAPPISLTHDDCTSPNSEESVDGLPLAKNERSLDNVHAYAGLSAAHSGAAAPST